MKLLAALFILAAVAFVFMSKSRSQKNGAAPDEPGDKPRQPEAESSPSFPAKPAGKSKEKETPQTEPLKKLPPHYRLAPPPPDFVGRENELKEIEEKATTLRGALITGDPDIEGLGKTALALKAAEKLLSQFPDVQIFLDLKGSSANPLSCVDALTQVIRAFNPRMKLSEDEDELKNIYQAYMAENKTLLVLDDAGKAEQVKALIPPAPCFMIVTSSTTFMIPQTVAIKLKPLDPKESKKLFLAFAPQMGVMADQLAKVSGNIPMTIQLFLGMLRTIKDMNSAFLANALSERHNQLQLNQSAAANPTLVYVEETLKISYKNMDKNASKVFRKLTIFPGSFDAKAEEFVCQDVGNDYLAKLVKMSLVIFNERSKRYRLHPMVVKFADRFITKAEQAVTRKRHANYYLTTLTEANERMKTEANKDVQSAVSLFNMEFGNIRTGQAWSEENVKADEDAPKMCYLYTESAARLLGMVASPATRVKWFEAALAAARQLSDSKGELEQVQNLANAHLSSNNYFLAIANFKQAMEIAHDTGKRFLEATLLNELGLCHVALGQNHDALAQYEKSMQIAREMGDKTIERTALNRSGHVYFAIGDAKKAADFLEQSLAIAVEIHDRQGERDDLESLGKSALILGDYGRGAGHYEKALAIDKSLQNALGEGNCHWGVSQAFAALGDRNQAIARAQEALKAFQRIKHPNAKKVLSKLQEWRVSEPETPAATPPTTPPVA